VHSRPRHLGLAPSKDHSQEVHPGSFAPDLALRRHGEKIGSRGVRVRQEARGGPRPYRTGASDDALAGASLHQLYVLVEQGLRKALRHRRSVYLRGDDAPYDKAVCSCLGSRECLKIQDKPYSGLLRVVKTEPEAPFVALSATSHGRLRALQRIFRHSLEGVDTL
jgi:hypothetical protein